MSFFPQEGKETDETEESEESDEKAVCYRHLFGFLRFFKIFGFLPTMLWSDLILLPVAILVLVVLLTMLGSLWVWVPYVPTPPPVVRRMIALAELKGNETVYDLGCGDARILIAAKRKHPGIRAIGYELPLGIYLLARFRVALARSDVTIRMGNFLKADLSDAGVMFLYLVPEVLPELLRKFQKELKSGTRIISHGFALPGKIPLHEERVPLPSWRIFSKSGKLGPRVFVYAW